MGFTIFESSTSFKPSDYGLKVGDIIYVVCVGGGASGDYATAAYDSSPDIVPGKAGGSSSFGSYITALGGGACGSTQGHAFGLKGKYSSSGGYPYSGCGAGGWVPGLNISAIPIENHIVTGPLPATTGGIQFLLNSDGTTYYSGIITTQGGGLSNMVTKDTYAKSTCPQAVINGIRGAGPSQGSHNWRSGTPITGCAGGNGAGYGAGGGGGLNKNQNEYNIPGGGNSGEIKKTYVKLSSLSAIAVTVGAGGAQNTYGGQGASGCVAIYW